MPRRNVRRPIPKFQPRYDPARIPELADAYLDSPYRGGTRADADRAMEDAGSRIVNGVGTRLDVNVIYEWKSKRRMDLFKKNSDADVAQALQDAINAKSVRKAVAALTRLEGVGIKTASAILTAMFPERYTVLDIRGLEALGVDNGESIRLYLHYLRACRNMAKRYGVTLRNFDRANWQWSKTESKHADCCCENEAQTSSSAPCHSPALASTFQQKINAAA